MTDWLIDIDLYWCLVLVNWSTVSKSKAKLLAALLSVSYTSSLLARSKRAYDSRRIALVAPRASEVLTFPWRSVCCDAFRCRDKGHASKVSTKHSAISQTNKCSSERSPIQSVLNQRRLEARFAAAPALDEFCHIKARWEQNKDGARQIGSREACEWHEWGWQFKTHLWFPAGASRMRDYVRGSTPSSRNYNY